MFSDLVSAEQGDGVHPWWDQGFNAHPFYCITVFSLLSGHLL